MLDTVRLGVALSVTLDALAGRGWGVTVHTSADGDWDARAHLVTAEGVRLSYGAGFGWLSAECSLPRLVCGDNAVLLDWAGCLRGLARVRALAGDAAGARVPAVGGWRVARLDAVWAWPVNPAPYVAALRWSRLPYTEPRSYAGSVSWVTLRGGRVRGRVYDKAAETGRVVALPLRLERQTRPRREIVRVGDRRLPAVVGDLDAGAVRGVLLDAMQRVGLDRTVPGPLGARARLVEVYGPRRGRNLWRVLREVQDFGGCWPSDIAARTRRRYERLLRAAGIRALSWEGELPALSVPTLH